jgi:hypothetical protein
MTQAKPVIIGITLAVSFLAGPFILFGSSAAAAARTEQRAAGLARNPFVEIAGGRMTIVTEGAPVKKVLELLAAKAALRIAFHGDPEDVLQAAIDGQPVESGLRDLFEGANLAFFYSSTDKAGPRRLSEVLILDAGHRMQGKAYLFGPSHASADFTASRLQEEGEGDEKQSAVIAELRERLRLGDPDERARAAQRLGKTWSDEALAPLAEALTGDPAASVREAVAAALGRTWSENAVPPLIEALAGDRDAGVREQAARALGQTAGSEAVPVLAHALSHDRRWFVREAAAVALGTIGGPDALEALSLATSGDRDRWVSETAALAALGTP